MHTHKMKLLFGVLTILSLFPSVSSAYGVTSQSVTRLSEDTALFTITYRFGFLNRELKMPIGAVRTGDTPTKKSPYVQYAVLENSETATMRGKSSALVLSTAEVRDNEYYLPAGKNADFTLAVLLTIPKNELRSEETMGTQFFDDDLAIGIQALPFTMIDRIFTIKGAVAQTEINEYCSPEIDFGDTFDGITRASESIDC